MRRSLVPNLAEERGDTAADRQACPHLRGRYGTWLRVREGHARRRRRRLHNRQTARKARRGAPPSRPIEQARAEGRRLHARSRRGGRYRSRRRVPGGSRHRRRQRGQLGDRLRLHRDAGPVRGHPDDQSGRTVPRHSGGRSASRPRRAGIDHPARFGRRRRRHEGAGRLLHLESRRARHDASHGAGSGGARRPRECHQSEPGADRARPRDDLAREPIRRATSRGARRSIRSTGSVSRRRSAPPPSISPARKAPG